MQGDRAGHERELEIAAVNSNDIVPMAWNNLSGILSTFSIP
jgi:hypothetical protein